MELVPITPGEPIVPEPIDVEITPGRPPGERPFEIEPGRSWNVTDAAPPLPEPERVPASSGWGGGEPPKAPTTIEEAFGGRGPMGGESFLMYGQFPSVDEVSRYYSFRSGLMPRNKHRAFGITIDSSGYLLYALLVLRYHPRLSWAKCREVAWRFIVTHQVHHFLVDRAVSTLEGVLKIAQHHSRDLWQAFHFRMQPYSCLEESACCAYSLRHVVEVGAARTLMGLQPNGYAEVSSTGTKIMSTSTELSHQKAVSRLLSMYLDPATNLRQTGLHNLMQYKDNYGGLRGDLYYNFSNAGPVTIPVRFGK